jgi:hypothetical protein
VSTAARVDMVADQGADFAVEIYWTDYANIPHRIDAPIRMEVRDNTGNLVLEFLPNAESGELEDVGISYNPDRGMIIISKGSQKMSTIPPGQYFYDLFVTYEDRAYVQSTGEDVVTARLAKLLEGVFTVNGRITRNV